MGIDAGVRADRKSPVILMLENAVLVDLSSETESGGAGV